MLLLFALLAFVGVTFAENICQTSGALGESDFKTLQSKLQSFSTDADRLAFLTTFIQSTTAGLAGNQTAALLKTFTFASSKVQAVQVVANHLLGLSCADVIDVLKTISYASDQLTALTGVVNYVIRSDLSAKNATIVNVFKFSLDKDAARQIIANSKPISCTFGPIPQQRVIFIIDVSGSMSSTFKFDGKQYTRISFVQRELDNVIRYQLASFQFFNLEQFSSSVAFWEPSLQPVSNDTITSAVKYAQDLKANGGTNTGEALKAAFKQQNVMGIYLLSDGVPDSPSEALQIAKQLEAQQHIPILATALSADSGGKSFMKQLAQISGGVYREINGQ